MRPWLLMWFAPWMVGLLACGAESGSQDLGDQRVALTPAQQDAVVDLVNEASFSTLDDEVALDKRAAENIVAHRVGPDGLAETADDDPFDDLAELDAVPWVGPAALGKLADYAQAQGLVDEEAPGEEAQLILGVANSASFGVLDDDVGLDKRAAENIVAHRAGPDATEGTADDDPFDDLAELDELSYVGPAALDALLAYAQSQASSPCLIISEYIEGQGMNNKALELFNCGTAPLDLGGYAICLVRNEATTCSETAPLGDTSLDPGQVRTVCRTKGGTFNDPMELIASRCEIELPGLMTFNGDDRIALFHDHDADGLFGEGDVVTDMIGRFGYQPPVWTWQDVTLRRCDFTPNDGQAFYDHGDYFFEQSWGNQQDYGVAPVEGCP